MDSHLTSKFMHRLPKNTEYLGTNYKHYNYSMIAHV